jgi:predicted 2-oxoglutarate/Fe(II)-dependent dioxygenase YbiX
MFGSLIVQLPGDHSGGDLVISHGGSTQSYGKTQLGGGLSYVAFYADCTHEVKPVTRGHRWGADRVA